MKPMMIRCFTCHNEFQFGPHIYDGKHIARYDVTVCRTCYAANWDGWAPHFGKLITKHLEDKGLPIPALNVDGFLPRDG